MSPPRAKKSLESNKEVADRALTLTTIRRDVPVELDLEKAKFGTYIKDEVVSLLGKLEFHSILPRIPNGLNDSDKEKSDTAQMSFFAEDQDDVDYKIVDTDEAMEEASESGRLKLLAYGPEAGYSIFSTTDDRFIAHTGHPEYNATRLAEEAKRDHGNPEVPTPANFDFNNPLNCWRSHRNTFFAQWVSYCYLKISTHDMAVGKI